MDVNAVRSGGVSAGAYTPPVADVPETAVTVPAPEKEAGAASVYEPSGKDQVYKPDANKIKAMWDENNAKVESFRRMIEGLLNKQVEKTGVAKDWWHGPQPHSKWPPFIDPDKMVNIDDETRAAAQRDIEEGGYYSVEETAKRILSFAVSLSGGDPAKAGILKDAALQGFAEAEKVWGGELPEISKKTLEAVKKGFDEWEKAGSADAITLLNKKAGTAAV